MNSNIIQLKPKVIRVKITQKIELPKYRKATYKDYLYYIQNSFKILLLKIEIKTLKLILKIVNN